MVIKISCSKLRDSDEIPPTHKKRKKEKKEEEVNLLMILVKGNLKPRYL